MVLVFLLALVGCWQVDAVNKINGEFVSPDGKKKVVVFSRAVDATTGVNTQASVLEADEKLSNEPGNAFIIDNGSADVFWRGDDSVLIVLDSHARVFKKETFIRGVTVEYR